jgi:uncharacterized protein involved in exopolysaccharide biosynthesis
MAADALSQFNPHAGSSEPVAARPPGVPPDDRELDLAEHVRALWRFRLLLVLVVVATGAAAFVYAKRMTPIYQTAAKIWVSPPKFAVEQSLMINVANFRALLENHEMADQVIRELHLDRPPYSISAIDFVNGNLDVTNLRDSNVLLIGVTLPDPQLAAAAANKIAEHAARLATRLGQEDSVAARDTINAYLEKAKAQLDAAEKARDAFRRQAQLELLQKDVETLLEQRGDLRRINVEIEAQRARIARSEEELQKRGRIDTLKRSIDKDSALVEGSRTTAGTPASPLSLQLNDEVLNKTYEALDQDVSERRSELAGLERERAQLVSSLHLNAPQLAQLNQLYTRESELGRLDTEYDLAKAGYLDVANRLQQAQVLIASRSAQIQILDRAWPPTSPIWPRPFRTAVMAATAALMLAAIGVVIISYVSQRNGAKPLQRPRTL